MRIHSYVGLAFAYLSHAIKQEAMMVVARQMQEDADMARHAQCGEQLELRRGAACFCGAHVERGYDVRDLFDDEADRRYSDGR